MTEFEKSIVTILNQYCFQWVWNEPVSELRENIRPALLSQFSQCGSFSYNNKLIPLPSDPAGPYFLYAVPTGMLNVRLSIPTDTWIDTATLCNDHRVLWNMYSWKGQMFHKSQVFVLVSHDQSKVIIAVHKAMVKKFLDLADMDKVYFTVYMDSDTVGNCTVETYQVPPIDYGSVYRLSIQHRLQTLALSQTSFQVYVNGLECSGTTLVLNTGDYVDVIVDEDIKIEFDLDISSSDQHMIFFSTKDKLHKQLIHIPKALNPENKVITRNTCDVWVRRKHPKVQAVEGLYLHHVPDRGLSQVTHNDMAIPVYILDAMRDYLDTQEITLHVVCRIHDKDNVLTRDPSYMDLLYTQDDATICQALLGKNIPANLDFWTAPKLEASTYVSMMFDLPELYDAPISYYVDGLGFYHTAVLIAGRVVTSTIDQYFQGNLEYHKSPMYQKQQCFPVVYRNGVKIRGAYVLHNDVSDTNLAVHLKDPVYYTAGDEITTVMFLDGKKDICKLQPSDTIRSTVIPYQSFRIYEVKEDTFYPVRGMDFSSTTSYRDVTGVHGLYAQTFLDNGTTRLDFSLNMLDKTYLVYNEVCTYAWEVDISTMVDEGVNLVIPLNWTLADDLSVTVPILNQKTVNVYLNGKYLIKDLDYRQFTGYSMEGDPSFTQITIQSMEYLLEGDTNLVEVVVNTAEIEDYSTGFQLNNLCTDNTPANLWFPEISLCHVDGRLETRIIDHGLTLELPAGKYRQGAPFEVQTSLPKAVKDYLTQYHTNTDKQRLIDINTYFGQHLPPMPKLVLIPQSHRVYCSVLNRVLRDVLFGDKKFADDPDLAKVKEQLLDYQYLYPTDLVLSATPDTRFVDFWPAYRQYIVIGENVPVLKAIIKAVLPAEEMRDSAVTYL